VFVRFVRFGTPQVQANLSHVSQGVSSAWNVGHLRVYTLPDETCAEKITEEAHLKRTQEEVLNVLTRTTTDTITGEASAKQSADQEADRERGFFFPPTLTHGVTYIRSK
jgi:hypothetical protein